MDTETATREYPETLEYRVGAGAVGGLVGGVGMGAVLHGGANLMPFIGALYGWPTVVGGWVAHLVNSVLIGVLFSVLASRPVVREQVRSVGEYTVVGVMYGAAVGLVTGGVMLPITMNVLGVESLPEPLVPLPGLLGGFLVVLSVGVAHVVYGVLLGAVYGVVHGRPRSEVEPVV